MVRRGHSHTPSASNTNVRMRIIRGKYGRRRFDVPRNITARPTTDFARENIFNVIENLRDIEGSRVVDLFAGTGAVSFEFLSRGAAEVTAVEQAPVQTRFIEHVRNLLGDEQLRVVRGDVFKFLETVRTPADIVFADPPYDHPRFDEVADLILGSGLMAKGTLVILEHGKTRSYARKTGFLQHRAYGSVNFSIFEIE